MSFEGATQWASNPLGKAMDQAGLGEYKPNIHIGGYNIDGTALTNPVGAVGQGANLAKEHEKKRQIAKAKEKAEEKAEEAEASDDKAFKKFKEQDPSLLSSGASTELFIPQYKTGKHGKETEALAAIFQARKDQAAQRQSRPGVSQTRSGAL